MKNYNAILDAMINEAANEVAASEDEEGEKDIENSVLNIEFSEEHEIKMQKFFRKERRAKIIRAIVKYCYRAACIFFICAAVIGASIIAVKPWRTRFKNFVYKPHPSHITVCHRHTADKNEKIIAERNQKQIVEKRK